MVFDPQAHQDTQVLIQAAIVRRRLKGLPEEKNITVLYREIFRFLELPFVELSSRDADHLPGPYEMGQLQAPREKQIQRTPSPAQAARIAEITKKLMDNKKVCPKCGKKSMELTGICGSCIDSEGGKFKTAWVCAGVRDESGKVIDPGCCWDAVTQSVQKNCPETEKTTMSMSQWFSKFGIDVGQGIDKQAIGIKTITDKGLE